MVPGQNLWCSDKLHDNRGSEIESGEREPTEQHVQSIHSAEMHERIERHGKGSVEPSASLANKLRGAFWHIGLALGRLDVAQMPFLTGLCDQFEAKNSVLGKEHDTNVAKGAFQGLIKHVGDLVLKILHSDKWIEKHLSTLAQHDVDLTTSTAEVTIVIETFPERQQGARARFRSGVDEDGDFWVQNATEGVKQPAMRVDLLAVLLLETENKLHGREIAMRLVGVGADKLLIGRHRDLTGILENMSDSFLAVNVLFENAILIDTNSGEHVKDILVDFIETIKYKTHHDFLPGWTSLVPELGSLQVHNVLDVLHCDCDEELGVTVVHSRAEVETVAQGEVVRVAGSSCVAHLCEFLLHAPRTVAIPGLDGILDGAGDWVVDTEDGALYKLDLAGL
ncbi:hypothetical protein HG531_001424 [Fusarium graminearum]|nr:hypothetical protein HG531_001424 [Fusarium graminearum]